MSKDIFAEIRKKKTKEMLETGKHWIVTKQGIPMFLATTEEVMDAIYYVVANKPEITETIKVFDLLESKEYTVNEFLDKYKKEKEKPVEQLEGLVVVKFEMRTVGDAKSVHTIFDAVVSGKYEFRSAVNLKDELGVYVRAVMYEKSKKYGRPVEVYVKNKETAWALMQTLEWIYKDEIRVVAVRRLDKTVEVAYIRKGIPKPPPKEKYIMFLKKTDGWTFVKEPKP